MRNVNTISITNNPGLNSQVYRAPRRVQCALLTEGGHCIHLQLMNINCLAGFEMQRKHFKIQHSSGVRQLLIPYTTSSIAHVPEQLTYQTLIVSENNVYTARQAAL